MDVLKVSKLNEVYIQLSCDSGIAKELSEHFSFYVPGYQFMPAYKMRIWNGKINLFNLMNFTLYIGLLSYLKEFCISRKYKLIVEPNIENKTIFSENECKKFLETLKLPFEPRDYQISSITHAVKTNRCLLLSPTASGKSLLIYGLARFYNKKTLIIVPTISLVSQMFSDFKEYSKLQPSFNVDKVCHPIYGGQDKITDKKIVISTWQSIYKLPKSWFSEFDVVIGDEVHQFKAKSLISIMNKLENAKYRFGLTGTLDGTETHRLVLEGLFGEVHSVTTTKKLMDKKQLADLSIDCVILKYDKDTIKKHKKDKYQDEIKFLIENHKRNKFIRNLAISTKSNCLVIFQYVDNHGKILYDMIKRKLNEIEPNRKVFFVSGDTDAKTREDIRKLVEKETNAIIVASSGVFSTGVNIRNLENIIFASPTKSRIKTLQSIGRTLRIGDNSDKAKLYDIVDDMTDNSHKNFAIKHFLERVKIYNEEKFKYKLHKVNLF
jgi:superfamily II DNA or RNA helicase